MTIAVSTRIETTDGLIIEDCASVETDSESSLLIDAENRSATIAATITTLFANLPLRLTQRAKST